MSDRPRPETRDDASDGARHDAPARVGDIQRKAQQVEAEYSGSEDRPLGSYVAVIAAYAAVVSALGAAVARRGGPPDHFELHDLALAGIATHKLSRMIAKDTITSPLRAPFTRFAGVSGPSELHEEVRGDGARHAIGELVTCPFCTSQWVGTAFVFGLALAPRATRLAAALFSTIAASDALQLVYARLERSA